MKVSTQSLTASKDDIISNILDAYTRQGLITTQEEHDRFKESLETRYQSDDSILQLQYREQNDVTNSKNFSESNQEMLMDILSVFNTVDKLDQSVVKQQKINDAIVSNLEAQIMRASDKLQDHIKSRREVYSGKSFTENFRSAENFEKNVAYYNDRDGNEMTESIMMSLDKNAVTIPKLAAVNVLYNDKGLPFGSASIKTQLGEMLKVDNAGFEVNNVLDTSMQTYWEERILTDSPMRVEMDSNFYNLKHGAMCSVEIKLEATSSINEIVIVPKSAYPMNLVAIKYFKTDKEDEQGEEILSPNHPEHKSIALDDLSVIRFESVICKRILLLFNQIHYSKSNYFYDEAWSKNDSILAQLNSYQEPIIGEMDLFKPMYSDRAILDQAWVVMNKMIADDTELTLDSLIGSDEDAVKIPVNKYLYSYGLSNIKMTLNSFGRTGIYVSKSIYANKAIAAVSLSSKEKHPLVDGRPVTDIEYYITVDENGPSSKWIPIMPKGKEYVDNELLLDIENGENTCNLRFSPEDVQNIIVMENNIPITPGTQFAVGKVNEEYNVTIHNPTPGAIYSAKYKPTKEAYFVELKGQDLHKAYEQVVASGSVVTLSNRPYIFSTSEMIVRGKDGSVLDESKNDIINVTDTLNPSGSYKNFSSEKLQYYIDDNKIFFNKALEDETNVDFKFSLMPEKIRVKIIARKNTYVSWLTPSVESYTVDFSVL